MNRPTARLLAEELMDIQLGSAEDAKHLLDDAFFSADERAMVEEEIDQIADERANEDRAEKRYER